jgi:hypothetical protein
MALSIVILFFVWPSSEFFAQVEVLDSCLAQRSLQFFPVEMGNMT